MSSRTYLSIGDVLSLLREEFPDVTISKIRFLESQGLVNPERSPSGYRKFFEHDVERLRWVLRQQREHFLPLKVIRDRLAEGDVDLSSDLSAEPAAKVEVEAAVAARHGNGRASEPAHVGVGAAAAHGRHVAGAGAGAGVSTAGGAGRADDDALTQADSDAMARILADASRRAALLPDAARGGSRAEENAPVTSAASPVVAVPTTGRARGADVAAAGAVTADASDVAARRSAESAASTTSPAPASAATGKGVDAVAAAVAAVAQQSEESATTTAPESQSKASPEASPAGGAKGAAAKPARSGGGAGTTSSSMVTGASLTTEELCTASGLSEAELSNLEGFGLISSVVVAGITTYDEDALTVANLAAELRVFGIEPRHLRLYKNAVDREVGLIEQVIIPLLRQRNPESRQRAIDSAEQLGTLGQTMRTTLLRAALRQHLGG